MRIDNPLRTEILKLLTHRLSLYLHNKSSRQFSFVCMQHVLTKAYACYEFLTAMFVNSVWHSFKTKLFLCCALLIRKQTRTLLLVLPLHNSILQTQTRSTTSYNTLKHKGC